jgi:hypothetical protein
MKKILLCLENIGTDGAREFHTAAFADHCRDLRALKLRCPSVGVARGARE